MGDTVRKEPTDAQWQCSRSIRDEISTLLPELTDKQLHIIRNCIIAGLMRHKLGGSGG